ncbi:MAG: CHAT domain-containing protein, partial [Bacteroidota bacterium]
MKVAIVPSIFIFIALLAPFAAASQVDSTRIRKRAIDYTEYDKLTQSLGYAPDKIRALKKLMDVVGKLFTPEDEEYFFSHKMAGIYSEQAFDHAGATQHFHLAMEAYEKYYPFYNRGYPTVSRDDGAYCYLDVARIYRALNLFDKAARFLESKRKILEQHATAQIRQQFYNEYAQALLGIGQYAEAIETGLKLKELTESGSLGFNMPPADSIYKIRASDPPEVQQQMRQLKAQYETSMKQSMESVTSGQRLQYNTILANAYFNQFQYEEALPYEKAWVDELKKLMDYSSQALKQSMEQMKTYDIADSIRKQINDSFDFVARLKDIGGTSSPVIISALKTNQPKVARQYATGRMDKAVYHQLNQEYSQAEEHYQASFEMMRNLSRYKFSGTAGEQYYNGYLPFYINLQVQSGKFDKAYQESMNVLTKEENTLKKNFQFFSEGEKKEFFKAYNQKLERYFSLLLLMTEKDTDRTETKGMILDVTREQEKQLKRVKDKTTLQRIAQIRRLRDKLAAFYQVNLKSPNPALSDSINRYSIRINDLERKVNEKLGTATDILKPVRWTEVQTKLKGDEVYLEILRIKRDNFAFDKPVVQYWAFVIKPGATKPTMFKISEGEAFEGRGLKNYQNRIRSLLEDDDSYKTYWARIHDELPETRKFFFSGDGAYHIINPLTLKDPATGKFMLNEITLTRVSTGRDLLHQPSADATNSTIMLVGNPDFDMHRKSSTETLQLESIVDFEHKEAIATRAGFVQLPGTQREVEAIQSLAAASGIKAEVLSGNSANESKIKKLASPRILHVATHGEFDQLSKADSYLKSKLILAGAADEEP